MKKTCFAPSELVSSQVASSFGAIAESIVGADYLRNEVKRLAVFPLSQKEFVDFGDGFGNTTLYVAFMKANHPRLSVSELLHMSGQKGVKIPDLVTSDPPRRTEFYEIKPDSGSGRTAGRTKIANIDALMQYFSLPYVPGTKYSPNKKKVELFSGLALGVDVKLWLEFDRISPGLLVYRVCVEGKDVVPAALLLAIAALIIIILTRGRILRGGPKPFPVPLPLPL